MTEANTSTPQDLPLNTRDAARQPGHVPALDGVRGLAILMVMFFHFDGLWHDSLIDNAYGAAARFGWAGVDLFFVLSGFLITGILMDSRKLPNYFRNFYARRVLRIFPLYYLVIIIGTITLPLLPLGSARQFFPTVAPSHLPFYWLYFSNFPIVFGHGDANNDLMAITWSLAIEEQFYLFWPLIVLMCKPGTIMKICLALVGGSLAFRAVVAWYFHTKTGVDPNYAFEHHRILYEFTPARMDGIALGSMIAIITRQYGIDGLKKLVPLTWILAPLAAVIVLGCIRYHHQTIFNHGGLGQTIGYTAVAIGFASLLIWVVTSQPQGIFNRIFSMGWLRFLGKYSYAIYLCHMPIQRLMREYVYNPKDWAMWHNSKLPGQMIFYVLCTVPTIITALLSWHLIEKHFLSLKKYFPTKHPPEITPAPSGVSQAQDSAAP